MILTFKIKHFAKLDLELEKAIKVAIYAISCRNKKLPTSKDVKEFKLKSVISNQILRKYHSQKKLKSINTNKVKLTVPGQDIKFDKKKKLIKIVPLKIEIKNLWFDLSKVEKINQIELDKKYAYITATCTNKAE